MGIISSSVASDTVRRGGRRNIVYEFTDHLDRGYHSSVIRPSDWDATSELIKKVTEMDVMLTKQEMGGLIFKVEQGGDAIALTQNPEFLTRKKAIIGLIKAAMRSRDSYFVLAVAKLIDSLSLTQAQIETYLDRSSADVTELLTKTNAILNAETDLLTAKIERDW